MAYFHDSAYICTVSVRELSLDTIVRMIAR